MRSRIAPALVLGLIGGLIGSSASAHPARLRSRPSDPSYAFALAAANRFLHAWQMEDHETGIVMLTDSARQQASTVILQEFFSPGPQAAYEIARGKRLRAGAYSFPVVLFAASLRPRVSKMIVVQMSQNDWAVDRLP